MFPLLRSRAYRFRSRSLLCGLVFILGVIAISTDLAVSPMDKQDMISKSTSEKVDSTEKSATTGSSDISSPNDGNPNHGQGMDQEQIVFKESATAETYAGLTLRQKLTRVPSDWPIDRVQSELAVKIEITQTHHHPTTPGSTELLCVYSDVEFECYPRLFEALDDQFRPIYWGQHLPAGLDIQIDLDSGIRRARLPGKTGRGSHPKSGGGGSRRGGGGAIDLEEGEVKPYLMTELDLAMSDVLGAWAVHDVDGLTRALDVVEDLVHAQRHGARMMSNFVVSAQSARTQQTVGQQAQASEQNETTQTGGGVTGDVDSVLKTRTRTVDFLLGSILTHQSADVRRRGYLILTYSLANNHQATEALVSQKSISPVYSLVSALVQDTEQRAEVAFALGTLVRNLKTAKNSMVLGVMLNQVPEWMRDKMAGDGGGEDVSGQSPMDMFLDMVMADRALVLGSNDGKEVSAARFVRRAVQLYRDLVEMVHVAMVQSARRSLGGWCSVLHEYASESVDEDVRKAAMDAIQARLSVEQQVETSLCA